ncbi:short-chain fatty acid transporter [Fictibacillus phosphorivorans]|uniref:short-chain fatty acid transporter n=1 Tax=Fictibacillus phosphorivorans TaxID=1221500 RepID=UPI00203C03AB|nr:short-chain fatty acid transporter [Fictibacillus phosphorivorans]MCM3719674.1 short-chain fatty acid transporter [Fictibacillus phosphorivorans]MCM3777365.1 short-chain fatty acid transporter [Fictibacillus phosphorivorans]
MLQVLTRASNKLMQRYLPDPFIFVVLLTGVVFLLGLIITGQSPVKMVSFWGDGFWKLLEFSMQMVLILVTGYVMASSPFFKKMLRKLASFASTPGQAIISVTLVALLASWINWGFGLVIGAIFSKELARQVKQVDYRLLIASAYSGFVVWHAGLSGSIPLTIATPGHFMEETMGIIPTSETLFAPFNVFIVIAIFFILPITNRLMMNKDQAYQIDPSVLEDRVEAAALVEADTPADKLENSVWLSMIIGLLGIAYMVYFFVTNGFNLNINFVNFLFLFLGILLHKTPRNYINSVADAVKGASGIIIQFPFYAGIMGMMVGSGLVTEMSEWFVAISNEYTLPLFTFLSAGIVNIFVPSGGGQWAVQAHVVLDAADALGVSHAKAAMAVAWGDAWTNLIQPFWALPALAIAGLKAKDIMGFCLIALLVSGIIISAGFLIF